VFTDTHCHLYLEYYQDDLDAVLQRAWEAGLTRILLPGIDLNTSLQAMSISESDPRIYAAVGVHPNNCAGWSWSWIDDLREMAGHPKVCAVGEIGLDYYWDETPHDLQAEVLRAQLDLAAELDLPVVIHNRQAWDGLWPILTEWRQGLDARGSGLAQRPGVLHSFEGDIDQAQAAIREHFLIGISGPVTFKNARARQDLAAQLPLAAMLTETDSPYLTPDPFRGRRNEPAYVVRITDKIADLQQQRLESIANITRHNATRLFRWDDID